jgi:CheY-like chemotaxis protein
MDKHLERLSRDDLPDLILLDLAMPAMDGPPACRSACSWHPDDRSHRYATAGVRQEWKLK